LERWRATKASPWLIAALVGAQPKDPAAPDLIAAARQVAPDAPAFATATYFGILLQIRRGETDAARQWTDAALATTNIVNVDSIINLLRSERLAVARDWPDFLRYASRKPVAETFGGDIPDDADAKLPDAAFDLDSAGPLNRMVPLARWIDAASSKALPPK